MGKTYDYKPDLSGNLYLTSTGKSHRQVVMNKVQNAIDDMEAAVRELRKVEGLNTEALVKRLEGEIEIYSKIWNTIYRL